MQKYEKTYFSTVLGETSGLNSQTRRPAGSPPMVTSRKQLMRFFKMGFFGSFSVVLYSLASSPTAKIR